RNTHTCMSDCELLAKCLSQTDGVETVVSNGWPKDPAVVKDVTAIVLHTRLGGTVLFRGPQRRQVEEMLKQGVGITAIHWGTGAETPEGGPWLQSEDDFSGPSALGAVEGRPGCRAQRPDGSMGK